MGFVCFLVNAVMVYIAGQGTILAAILSNNGYVSKTQIAIGLLQLCMANPITKGSFKSEEDEKEGGIVDFAYVIYLTGYIWAIFWSLLIIKE